MGSPNLPPIEIIGQEKSWVTLIDKESYLREYYAYSNNQ
jgi:hypothetical protein